MIGAARMKAAAAHEVPLTAAIHETLPDRHQGAVGAVFGRTGTGFCGWSKSKELLDKRLTRARASMPRWTLHDLRRTFSTRLHDAGAQPLVIEALLAHKQQGVAAVYNRASFYNAKHSALMRWQEILEQVIEL
jgi:integrase